MLVFFVRVGILSEPGLNRLRDYFDFSQKLNFYYGVFCKDKFWKSLNSRNPGSDKKRDAYDASLQKIMVVPESWKSRFRQSLQPVLINQINKCGHTCGA